MPKPKPKEFNELEWFVDHSQVIRDLLWDRLMNVKEWGWTGGIHPYWRLTSCKGAIVSIDVGQSGFTIVIWAFGSGCLAQSVGVDIKDKAGGSVGTFHSTCKYGDYYLNARRIVEMTMYFVTREFCSRDRERFYPPKPSKPCPEADRNHDLWDWSEE